MKVKLRYGNISIQEDSSNLPQDGARMISYLEEIGRKQLIDASMKIAIKYLSGDIVKELCRSVFNHIVSGRGYPIYFSNKFILTSSKEIHSENMKRWDVMDYIFGMPGKMTIIPYDEKSILVKYEDENEA